MMSEENQTEEQPTFIVADRRKFNTDGSLREGVQIEEKPPQQPEPAAAAPATAPDVAAADAADVFSARGDDETNFAAASTGETSETDLPDDEGDTFDEASIPGAENPASFANFLLSLASQAAAALGLTENPMAGGGRRVDLETSRYWIEVLGMLHEKTANNLHPQEQKLFDGLLSDLRMQFVQLNRAVEAQRQKQEAELLKNAAQKFTGKDILGR